MRLAALVVVLLADTSPRDAGKFEIVLDPAKKLKLTFVPIPSVTFQMGADGTTHRVTFRRSYWIMSTEVTQAAWQAVMGANPSQFRGDDKPVDSVSWEDAREFIAKLAPKVRGRKLSLPTEAEWECACRAGSATAWCFGDDESKLGDHAWFGDSQKEEGSHPVASKKPNRWGLYDMHGNVLEWVEDWMGEYGGDAVDPTGPATGQSRVVRGGGWYGVAKLTQSGRRHGYAPTMRGRVVGFRLVAK